MRSPFQTHPWETDHKGWSILAVSDGWLFLIDPVYTPNYQGIEVFLCKEDALLGQPFTKVQSVQAARRVCERLIENNSWRKFTRQTYVHRSYRRAA